MRPLCPLPSRPAPDRPFIREPLPRRDIHLELLDPRLGPGASRPLHIHLPVIEQETRVDAVKGKVNGIAPYPRPDVRRRDGEVLRARGVDVYEVRAGDVERSLVEPDRRGVEAACGEHHFSVLEGNEVRAGLGEVELAEAVDGVAWQWLVWVRGCPGLGADQCVSRW